MLRELKRNMLTKQNLKERGWTDALIKKYLHEPDECRQNPAYKSAAPMCLFDEARMMRIERTAEFAEDMAKTERRRQATQKVAERRAERTLELLDQISVEVPLIEWDVLVRDACASYNYLERSIRDEFHASPSSNPRFLERICVNFLRHECSQYEHELIKVAGRVGADDARSRIKKIVLDAIAGAYPTLAAECHRQSWR